MIELHGWITVRTHEEPDISEKELTLRTIDMVRKMIDSMSWFRPQIKTLNGEIFLEFTLFCNHANPEVDEILKFCSDVGKAAANSYGLIYLRDDEDSNGNSNRFQVFAIARGNISRHSDMFLSPCIPTIEDAEV